MWIRGRSGRVVMPDGTAAPSGLQVWMRAKGVDHANWTWTKADGSFVLDGLFPKPHAVYVRNGSFVWAIERLDVSAGELRDVELVVCSVPAQM